MAGSSYSSSSRKQISRHIKIHKKEGMPQRQAVAAAMSEARRSGKKVPKRKGAKKSKRGGSKSQHAKAGRKGGKAAARKR